MQLKLGLRGSAIGKNEEKQKNGALRGAREILFEGALPDFEFLLLI